MRVHRMIADFWVMDTNGTHGNPKNHSNSQ